MRRRPVALLATAALALGGGCRVDGTVTIDVTGRGGTVSARVELDREAVAILGGDLEGSVVAADLQEAGWEVTGPRRMDDASVVVEASKAFSAPDGLAAVVGELAGDGGPLRDFQLSRERGLTETRYRLRGHLDLSEPGGVTGVDNAADLPERLREAGIDPAEFSALLTERAREGLHLAVVVDLPGSEPVRVEAEPGGDIEVAARSEVPERTRPLLLGLAVALLIAAVAVVANPIFLRYPSRRPRGPGGAPD